MSIPITHTDEVASVLLLILSGGIFIVTRPYPSGIAGTPGPAVFPRIIAGVLTLLALYQLGMAFIRDGSSVRTVSRNEIINVIVPILFLIGYVLILPWAGFVITTLFFLISLMYYSGARRFRIVIPISIAVVIVLQNVFIGFLHVPLPRGPFRIDELITLISINGGFFPW